MSEAGPKRTSKDTQFKKGQSGNPSGRPRGSGTLANAVLKELGKPIEVTENGRRRKITKLDAVAMSLTNAAIKDARLAALVVKIVAPALVEKAASADVPLDAEDKALLADFLARNSGNSSKVGRE